MEIFASYQLTPVCNLCISRRMNALIDIWMWLRIDFAFLTWARSIPQHCLIPRWYSSIPHEAPDSSSLFALPISMSSVAQYSVLSPFAETLLNTLIIPYPRRWTTLPTFRRYLCSLFDWLVPNSAAGADLSILLQASKEVPTELVSQKLQIL